MLAVAIMDEREQMGVQEFVIAGVKAMPGAWVDDESGSCDKGRGPSSGEIDGR
jgi:hypothetical protein